MKTKKMKVFSALVIILLFVQSFGNTIALGNYIQKNEQSYPISNATASTCGVAGVGLIVGVVGVGVAIVGAAYQLGYFLGTLVATANSGEAFQGVHQTPYDADDFSEFDS